MLDNEPTGDDRTGAAPSDENTSDTTTPTRRTRATRRRSTGTSASADAGTEPPPVEAAAEEAPAPVRRTRRKAAEPAESGESPTEPAEAPAKRTRRRKAAPVAETPEEPAPPAEEEAPAPTTRRRRAPAAATVLFVAPEVPATPPVPAASASATTSTTEEEPEARPSRRKRGGRRVAEPVAEAEPVEEAPAEAAEDDDEEDDSPAARARRRRRGRRGRGRGRGVGDEAGEDEETAEAADEEPADAEEAEEPLTRRRRRRRRSGAGGEAEAAEDGVVTVVKVRQPRAARDEVQGVAGSTRLEAKRQRRRDGRDQRRTRPPILSESEFLARREAVDRTMVVRQKGDRTQIAVLEDGILVEHYVTRAAAASMVGNVYLGKVQNVLPSMEAAFVDIGRGRNAVLYAGEVNWDATGLEGRARSIEQALKSGDSVLVQVTKDPIGHKGARLTSHIALSGRHLVYVPHGNASGISRKLPDTERKRLRDVLKSLVPDGAGVIVRTAAEGASEDELARDVQRLQAQWEDISAKAADGGAPVLLYEEPDLVIRVVRDLFNEDFRELVIQGADAYDQVEMYLKHVSPDLLERLHRHTGTGDVFGERRVDEQILKGLDRKVFLPSGGSLIIDRTEAMTVIDVNTGKYTGTGGNLEETVTRNNLEAAEEIVRQLRLRDFGGIIVIDFIDMVLESNRDLVLRRLTECLGRDRTKHQVTEITSLGLVQMTRKRIGQGLLEAFSETCEHCKGRGLIIHTEPIPERRPAAKAVAAVAAAPGEGSSRRRRRSTAVVLDEDLDLVDVADDESVLAAPDLIETDADPIEVLDSLDLDVDSGGLDAAAGSGALGPDGESDEAGDDEQVLGEGRRRGRRGGRRRAARGPAA
jgi:ribonuclease E